MHFTNLMTHAIRIARTMARDEAVAKSRSADHGGSLPSPRSTSTSTLHRDGGKLRQHFGRGLFGCCTYAIAFMSIDSMNGSSHLVSCRSCVLYLLSCIVYLHVHDRTIPDANKLCTDATDGNEVVCRFKAAAFEAPARRIQPQGPKFEQLVRC